MSKARLLLLLASPRAGSTNLGRLLESFEGVVSFGEVLHPSGGTSTSKSATFLDFLGLDYGQDRSRARDVVRAVVRDDPVAACGELLRFAAAQGATLAEMKLFPGFLSARTLDDVLREYRPICIRLQRTPIDAFISLQKAQTLGAWRSVDTTALRPRIDAREFGYWKWRQQNFYQISGYLMARNGIVPIEVKYEDFYREGPDLAGLRARLAEQGVDLGRLGRRRALVRQDRTSDRGRKVENWDAFVDEYVRGAPESGLMSWRLKGSRPALWAQVQAGRVIPRKAVRWAGAKVLPFVQGAGVLRA